MHKNIKIENLSIFTKETLLVDNINLEISTKKPLVLLGESGSGKSLVIDAIMGVLANGLETKGKILLDGVDLLSLSQKQKENLWGKDITLLPQEPWRALDPTMKIENQVKEVREFVYKDKPLQSQQRVKKELEAVKLQKFSNTYPHQLSGGMCQRLTLAITHVQEGSVLLVDEPTKGLDKKLCDSIVKKLNEQIDEGKLLFVITHDLHIAQNIKGSLGVMVDGQLVEYNNTDEIFHNPQNEYTKKIIQAEPKYWDIQKTPIQNETIIEVKNLSKSFGANKLFSDLSLTIQKGEIVSIVGESGSGKSSLGNIILKNLYPDSGSIKKNSKYTKIQFQKIYQDPPSAFLPNQILNDGFNDLLQLQKVNQKVLFSYLDEFNLSQELLQRKPNEISGGELQRLSIIRVLLLKPIFIFADEITSRLDPISQKEVLLVVKNIVDKEGLSLLLVTHDYELAQILSHKIISLEDYK